MKYRDFGSTGDKISALGFGCMRFPEYKEGEKWFVDEDKAIPMLREAYENGVNYFDSAPFYCNSNSEYIVGKALHDVRDKVMISTKIPLWDEIKQEDYRKTLEKSLKKLNTDYINYYHFWGINKGIFDDKIMALNLLEEAAKAKEEGLIRHISFSFHDNPDNIKHIIDTAQSAGVPMETMLVQYNILDRSHEKMIAYAGSKGMGVVAMGPVGGGRLAAPGDLYTRLTGKPAIATYELALKFVLSNPNISCALSGMENTDMLEKNLKVGDDDSVLNDSEWAQLGESLEQLKKFSELYCTGCGYCQPCPVGINIPHEFNMYTFYNVYGLKDYAKKDLARHFREGGVSSENCIDCGMCEEKCPQKIKIREELKRVEEVLK